jgi:hypothetical protein
MVPIQLRESLALKLLLNVFLARRGTTARMQSLTQLRSALEVSIANLELLCQTIQRCSVLQAFTVLTGRLFLRSARMVLSQLRALQVRQTALNASRDTTALMPLQSCTSALGAVIALKVCSSLFSALLVPMALKPSR